MAVPDLSGKVSASDLNRTRDRHSPPENDSFFDDTEEDDEEAFMESDTNSPNVGSNSYGNNTTNGVNFGAGFGNTGFGNTGFGNTGFGNTGFGNTGFGNTGFGNTQQQQIEKEDKFDAGIDFAIGGFKDIGSIIKQTFNNFKMRTVDDWALYSTHNIMTAIAIIVLGLLSWVLSIPYSNEAFTFWNLPATLISVGLVTGSIGLIGLGTSTIYVLKNRGIIEMDIDELDNLPTQMATSQEEYEEKSADLFESLFDADCISDDEDFSDEDEEGLFDEPEDEEDYEEDDDITYNEKEEVKVELNKISESLSAVPILSRDVLMNNLLPLFPNITPNFNKVETVDPDSDEFLNIETLALKALANASNKEEEQIESGLESLSKTAYSIEMKIKRIRGMNKLQDIEREMIAYFRSGVDDQSVQCTADIDGDFYKIIVSFGNQSIVSLRDVLGLPHVNKFFRDKSKALPFIVCLDELGNPIVEDAKTMDTMLIAGKPRSGKSWYLLEIILSLIAFNPPEQVQFLIIDPKESNLFKEVALLPHVCGLHNDSNILNILRDIINKEGARRKKLLSDNRCENIWDLRKKGVIIPVLYIVIDEVMTVKANLGENFKEFLSLMSTVVTQLPSQGIRLIIVPHRSKGVIEPSIRTNISFTAAVRADTEIVKETLDIPKWTRTLLGVGELAVKITGKPSALFGRSIAITSSDFDNSELIRELARSFYKMGVEMPDMSSLGIGYNQDLQAIKEELQTESNTIQFDANNISKADIEIDLSKYE